MRAGTGRAGAIPASALWRALPWGLAAAAALVAGWALWGRGGIAAPARDVIHLDIAFPPDVEPLSIMNGSLAISPDGRTVAMIGVKDGVRRLFLRRLDRAEAVEVPGTNGANTAAFSPDGDSVAFIPGDGSITRLTLADQQRKLVASGADLTGWLAWSRPASSSAVTAPCGSSRRRAGRRARSRCSMPPVTKCSTPRPWCCRERASSCSRA